MPGLLRAKAKRSHLKGKNESFDFDVAIVPYVFAAARFLLMAGTLHAVPAGTMIWGLFLVMIGLGATILIFLLAFGSELTFGSGPSRSSGNRESQKAAPSTPRSCCPACNISVHRDARFCEKCGAPMQPIAGEIHVEQEPAPERGGSPGQQPTNAVASSPSQPIGNATGQTASWMQPTAGQRKASGMAVAGFSLGIASVFLYWIGIVPILGLIFSIIALATYRPEVHTGRWMAITGLVLSALYTVMYLAAYGHLR